MPVYVEKSQDGEIYHTYKHGKGTVKIHKQVSDSDSDYTTLVSIAEHFANRGSTAELLPKMTRPPKFEYKKVYGSLIGTRYEGKCPDLRIDGKFYEHEGYVSTNPKRAFGNMVNHGLKQSDRLIIDKPDLTRRFMLRGVENRVRQGQIITEIWLREMNGEILLLYKKTDG